MRKGDTMRPLNGPNKNDIKCAKFWLPMQVPISFSDWSVEAKLNNQHARVDVRPKPFIHSPPLHHLSFQPVTLLQ